MSQTECIICQFPLYEVNQYLALVRRHLYCDSEFETEYICRLHLQLESKFTKPQFITHCKTCQKETIKCIHCNIFLCPSQIVKCKICKKIQGHKHHEIIEYCDFNINQNKYTNICCICNEYICEKCIFDHTNKIKFITCENNCSKYHVPKCKEHGKIQSIPCHDCSNVMLKCSCCNYFICQNKIDKCTICSYESCKSKSEISITTCYFCKQKICHNCKLQKINFKYKDICIKCFYLFQKQKFKTDIYLEYSSSIQSNKNDYIDFYKKQTKKSSHQLNEIVNFKFIKEEKQFFIKYILKEYLPDDIIN